MLALWIALGIGFGLLVLVAAYWALLTSMFPETLRTNEVYMITTPDLWKIRLCRYRKGRTEGEPVLFVHGFNANHHNFTCPPDASLVDYLRGKGYDCWAIDLRGCRSSIAPFERHFSEISMDDFLLKDLPAAIAHIRKSTGYAKVHWIGHSMGGMLLFAYAIEHGVDELGASVTLGAPLAFEGAHGAHVPWIGQFIGRHFPRLSGMIMRGFVPIVRKTGLGGGLFPINLKNLHPGMEAGHLYGMLEDPPPRALDELVHFMHAKTFRLKNGELDIMQGLNAVHLPLLMALAPLDPFVSVEAMARYFEALPSRDKKMIVLSKENGCVEDYSHCDLAFSREGAKEVFEPIAKWFEKYPIHERIRLVDIESGGEGYRPPLKADEREGILTGASFAHLTTEDEQPAAKKKSAGIAKKAAAAPVAKKPASKKTATAKTDVMPVPKESERVKAALERAAATAKALGIDNSQPAKPAEKKPAAKKPAAKKRGAKQ
jgi:pimeloyl-ACP methyl ester carboxylesterase